MPSCATNILLSYHFMFLAPIFRIRWGPAHRGQQAAAHLQGDLAPLAVRQMPRQIIAATRLVDVSGDIAGLAGFDAQRRIRDQLCATISFQPGGRSV